MATWITVSADDVRLLENEKTIMESVDVSQTLQQCVDSAANFARGYVRPPKAAAPQVPPEIVDDVVAIARVSYLGQEPSGTLLTDFRKAERDNAIAHLKDVAKGLISVTAPDVIVADTQGQPIIGTIQEGDTGNSREDLKRL
jgi:hypothetical protein